jgi:predicted nucleic acid-binding protein
LSLVIDASVALKWFVPEPGHEAALTLLRGDDELLAPDWLLVEVANALWKQWRRSVIDPTQIDEILTMLPSLLMLTDARALVQRASVIARTLDHPVYDCLYLAAAEARNAPLVTDDRALLGKAVQSGFAARGLQAP